jgi:hypothetical protein
MTHGTCFTQLQVWLPVCHIVMLSQPQLSHNKLDACILIGACLQQGWFVFHGLVSLAFTGSQRTQLTVEQVALIEQRKSQALEKRNAMKAPTSEPGLVYF